MAGTPVIEAEGLAKRYGDVLAVDDVSLRVMPGEVYGLLGLNGAGKTTTIRMLLGMVRPTTGAVSLLSEPVRAGRCAAWSQVGYLVETPTAYPELTVRENLEAMRRLRGLPGPAVVDNVIGRLSLTRYADRKAGTLSMGNAQRLGLAKALIHSPALLILDEPVNGLDPAGVAEIRDLLAGLAREQGVTILLSSHILTEVARLATRIGVIHTGRLVRQFDTADLDRGARPRLRVVTRDDAAAIAALHATGFRAIREADGILLDEDRAVHRPDDVATLLVNAGVPPTRLAVEQDDLETHFLRLVNPGAES